MKSLLFLCAVTFLFVAHAEAKFGFKFRRTEAQFRTEKPNPPKALCLITAGSNTTFERECPDNLNCTEMVTKEKNGVNVTYHFCSDSDWPECDEKDEKDEDEDKTKAGDSEESDENSSEESDENSDETDVDSHEDDRRKGRPAGHGGRRGGRRGGLRGGRKFRNGMKKIFKSKLLKKLARKGKKMAAKLRRRCRPRKTTVSPSTASATTTLPLP